MRALPVRMLPYPSLAALSGPHRFLVIDGSGSQGPGARGTQYRVHLCMELVPLSLTCIAITDQRTGKCLKHFTLEPGEVAVAPARCRRVPPRRGLRTRTRKRLRLASDPRRRDRAG
jgi:hypothetical protein